MKSSIPLLRVLLSFARFPDDNLITFANEILKLLYKAVGYPAIPMTAVDLLAIITRFTDAKALQSSGGTAATAEKDKQRAALVVALKSLAAFVQEHCNNDMAKLLSTGFHAVSQNRARYPLSKPMILRIVPGMTGEALVTTSTEKISRGCELRVAEVGDDGAPGEFRTLPFSTSSRNILVRDLEPGKLYAYQVRTVGGSTTYSDWSDLVVKRAA